VPEFDADAAATKIAGWDCDEENVDLVIGDVVAEMLPGYTARVAISPDALATLRGRVHDAYFDFLCSCSFEFEEK
jgi:hypothetical protein